MNQSNKIISIILTLVRMMRTVSVHNVTLVGMTGFVGTLLYEIKLIRSQTS